MAEFGVQAAQLSGPSGAGTSAIAPATAGIFDNGVVGVLQGIGETFAKGLELKGKQDAKAMEARVVGDFAKKQASLNNAFDTGGMDAKELGLRTRKLYNETVAGFSQYADEINKVAKGFQGFSAVGEAEDTVKTAKEFENTQLKAAAASGINVTPQSSPAFKQAAIDQYQTSLRVEKEYAQMIRRIEDDRKTVAFDQGQADRKMKDFSNKAINELFGSSLKTMNTFTLDLQGQMATGKITPQQAQYAVSQHVAGVMGSIQQAAGTDPSLAAPYASLMTKMEQTSLKMLDPKADLDTLKAQLDKHIVEGELLAVAQPGIRNNVAMSRLFGNVPEIALYGSASIISALKNMNAPSGDPGASNIKVVGNPEVEKASLEFLTKNMELLSTGKASDIPGTKRELAQVTGNLLNQIGDSLGRDGVTPEYLKNVAKFVASPAFGTYVKDNPLDPKAMALATEAFDKHFQTPIIKSVEQQLNSVFTIGKIGKIVPTGPAWKSEGLVETAQPFDKSNVQISFQGAGISFALKKIPVDPVERRHADSVIKSLRGAQSAVNELIHIGAHFEGSTNYAKTWEDNKHIFLPSIFPAPPPKQVETSGDYSLEKNLPKLAQLSVTEQRQSNAFELSDANLAELDKELSRKGLSATARAILEAEKIKLTASRGGR